MTRCLHAHATHPDVHMALALAAAQIEAQRHAMDQAAAALGASGGADSVAGDGPFDPSLGFIYFSDHYSASAAPLLVELQQRWPGVSWVGGAGVGIAAGGVEYLDEPALALMLMDLPTEHFRLFSGRRPLPAPGQVDRADPDGLRTWTALVHADPQTPDLSGLLPELAARTGSGYLFGGLVSGRRQAVQLADEVLTGGLSGVAFHQDVVMRSRITQGCQPTGPRRRITACDQNLVLQLDHQPALPLLLEDLELSDGEVRFNADRLAVQPQALQRLRGTLAGLDDANAQGLDGSATVHHALDGQTRVRHLIGLDPARKGVALADTVEQGMWLTFCRRDADAARRDLLRICAEIREELAGDQTIPMDLGASQFGEWRFAQPQAIAGAIYVSCLGRGGRHFGGPSAEMQWLKHALGDVPLIGFFADGEIAGEQIYGYTGVLTVFLRDAP